MPTSLNGRYIRPAPMMSVSTHAANSFFFMTLKPPIRLVEFLFISFMALHLALSARREFSVLSHPAAEDIQTADELIVHDGVIAYQPDRDTQLVVTDTSALIDATRNRQVGKTEGGEVAMKREGGWGLL